MLSFAIIILLLVKNISINFYHPVYLLYFLDLTDLDILPSYIILFLKKNHYQKHYKPIILNTPLGCVIVLFRIFNSPFMKNKPDLLMTA